MQLSSTDSGGQINDDKRIWGTRSKKKHKKLDAICEKAYSRSHSGVAFGVRLQKVDLVEDSWEANENEIRRSSRVRRAPAVLDASPTPAKKRRRVDKKNKVGSVDNKRVIRVKAESHSSRNVEEDSGGWRSRLRSRGMNVCIDERDSGGSPKKCRKKLFKNSKGVKKDEGFDTEETKNGHEELAQRDLSELKSKRLKVLLDDDNLHDENAEDEKELYEENLTPRAEETALTSEENALVSGIKDDQINDNVSKEDFGPAMEMSLSEHNCGNDFSEIVEDNCQLEKYACTVGHNQTSEDLGAKEKLKVGTGSLAADVYRYQNAEAVENNRGPEKHSNYTGQNQSIAVELDKAVEAGGLAEDVEAKSMEDGISNIFRKISRASDVKLGTNQVKEGRHCGLCGGGTNGKPPKRLLQDVNGSDKEEFSGGSTSEEPGYDLWDGFGDEPGWLGRLLGPINDRYGIAGIWVHQQCAVWSPEVYFAGLGCLKNVRAALWRGRVLKCSRCGMPGATIGCRVDRCPRTYHLPCARSTGSIFDHRKFLIACNDHRHLFQPHGSQYVHRLKKMKARKMKFDLRKMSSDALRKDIEAEEKWLENCGEDEEFLKRENKRLQRDLLRIAPAYIGGGSCDSGMQFQGWESIAGLQDVIQCMKEVVILPLLYPEFFGNLGLTPPRGVLLHGYPGTGKTLVVRALIGSCARGDKRIAYFSRKGADCLGKYVGDAERQLRLLFQVAEKSQPSIIFFDEIDGLAPCRTRQQDQTHSSVVSTLLALMDGLKSRGSVVVIGATNRPDAVDPALRRPGRFDREIYFPLPSANDREAILSLHTKKWPRPISGSLLKLVARQTVGFAGADLQSLCTQAALIALRRSFSLQELLSSAGERAISSRLPLPPFTVEEKDWLDALSHAPPPCSRRDAGIAANDVVSSPLAVHLVPFMLRPLSELIVSLYLDEHVWLPPSLCKSAMVIRSVIISALNRKKRDCDSWWLNLQNLLQESDVLHDMEDNLRPVLTEDAVDSFDSAVDIGDDTYKKNIGDDGYLKYKPAKLQRVGAHPGLSHCLSHESGKQLGFRILIAGKPSSGQRHLASCLLHCFRGNVEIRKLDLATMSQEGQGDVVQGLTHILTKCVSVHPCVVFLPRMDLWAVETCYETNERQEASTFPNSSKAREVEGRSEMQNAVTRASYLSNSFMEQVESMGITKSVLILATSDIPFEDLPSQIRQFFRCETLKSGLRSSLKDAVPRFLVHLDGNLSSEVVLDVSAANLSKNLVLYYIQLIYLGSHAKERVSSDKEISDTAVIKNIDAVPHSSDLVSDAKLVGKFQTALDTSTVLRNHVKGKSNLSLAISTFGYQILCYPHFAALCWVTSKLKEGPCADINGPWKGWPFNSCIARPVNPAEKVADACSSNIPKDKEKSFVVRGLVAIGLLAYRGGYTSVREVSLQARKVLELLVGHINSKIQAGKSKNKFFQVLSQVASFDDLVTSWAYALRGLEMDDPLLDGNPRLPCQKSFSNAPCDNGIPQADQCKLNIGNETLHESDDSKHKSQGNNFSKSGSPAMADLDLNISNIDEEGISVFEKSLKPNMTDCVASDVHLNSHLQKGSNADTSVPLSAECLSLHGNGFVQRESAVTSEAPVILDRKFDSVLCGEHAGDAGFPSSTNGTMSENGSENCFGNSSRPSGRLQEDPGPGTIFRSCSQCLINLHNVTLSLLKSEKERMGSNVSVEGFHDLVAALSAKLQAAVRKMVVTDSPSISFYDKSVAARNTTHPRDKEMCSCLSRTSEKPFMRAMECQCHSPGKIETPVPNFLKKSSHGLELKVMFKDGVVKKVESESDAAFHCEFMSLCLCALVNCLVMKQEFAD